MLALGTAGFAVIRPQLARTFLVPLSSMQELERGLYVDSQMPEAQRQQLRSDLAGARSRVAALFGNPVTAHPTIIATGDATIAGQNGASAGQSYYSAIGSGVRGGRADGPLGRSRGEDAGVSAGRSARRTEQALDAADWRCPGLAQ